MELNYSDKDVIISDKKSIFLAGPTPRDEETVSWRLEAIDYLKKQNFNGVVYIPENELVRKKDYVDQAEWERKALSNASIILFWVPRELEKMPAFTTNVEFGYWLAKTPQKIIYGRPNNARKVKYLDWLYQKESKLEIFDSLEKAISYSLEIISEVK
ncbi:MAG TPA: nucleoside 2-deoxyribosyltransferase domain-containing protein [Bacilli bacterium]|nr:nucleoside 2-deoxyribosyltransferase domain-containing protein [Bacilli bacterium]